MYFLLIAALTVTNDAAQLNLFVLFFLSAVSEWSKASTESVWQDLESLHALVFMQLQAVDAVEAVVFDQVERGVDGHLV